MSEALPSPRILSISLAFVASVLRKLKELETTRYRHDLTVWSDIGVFKLYKRRVGFGNRLERGDPVFAVRTGTPTPRRQKHPVVSSESMCKHKGTFENTP